MPDIQKYFIAIIPLDPLLSEIEAIKKSISENYNTKASLRSPAHITLHMPFEWKEDKEGELIRKIREFEFDRNFEIFLKGFSHFSIRVLFIGVEENNDLNDLHSKLTFHIKSRLNIFNEAESERAFHPHLTIALRDLRRQQFHLAWEEYKDKSFSAQFTVNSFWLLRHNGKKWEALQEFPFISSLGQV